MNPHAQMKNWNTLVSSFWELIYADEEKRFDFTTPMHLASLLEASHGRSELDHQIASSLPDDELMPGELHLAMMRLPWKDVFTTNYDRLLEKAAEKTDRSYNLVTNKNTLLYKTAPRIIKLHGSFPDVSPFIMTEDDFRTYPQKYPEFVNTVRQALIENVFCLLGFSGEDPNFLSWLGWLRDVMGNLSSPVYLITYNEKLNEADIKLNYKRGIDYVNMADIPEIKGINEGLTFFFEYLERSLKPQKEWNGALPYRSFENVRLKEIIPVMKEKRTNYPGWLYLPERYYNQFVDMEESFPYLGEKVNTLDHTDMLDFLFEIDWRLTVSACPYHAAWYIDAMKNLDIKSYQEQDNLNNDEIKATLDKVISLKLSLLRIYRLSLMWDDYANLESELLVYFEHHESDMEGRLMYERCQYYIMRLDFNKVRKILTDWFVSDLDYQSLFWKANILNSLGETEKSAMQLEIIRKNVNSALLKDNSNRAFLDSCSHLANLILSYYVPRVDVANIELRNDEIDFSHMMNMVRLKSKTKPFRSGTYDEHGFLLKDVNTVWSSGDRGFFDDFVNAYRTLFLLDRVGFPLQIFGRPIMTNDVVPAIKIMRKYDSDMVISTVLKMNGGRWIIRDVYSREMFALMTKQEAETFYSLWFKACNEAVEKKQSDSHLNSVIFETVIPTLVFMSVKLEQSQIVDLFKLYLRLYNDSNPEYQIKHLKLLYACMDENSIKEVLPGVFLTPIGKYKRNQDSRLCYPNKGYKGFVLTEDMIQILISGLKSVSFNNFSETLQRLDIIAKYVKDGLNNEELLNTVYKLRSEQSGTNLILKTYQFIPYNPDKERRSLESCVSHLVEKLINYQLDGNQFRKDLFYVLDCLKNLINVSGELDSYMSDVIDKVIQFLSLYKVQLISKENDYDYGLSQDISYFLTIFNKLLGRVNLALVDYKKFDVLATELKELDDDFEILSITAILMVASNKQGREEYSSFFDVLKVRMFSGDRIRRIDALEALKYLASHDNDMDDVVEDVCQYLRTSQNDYIHEYIEFLGFLRKCNKLELTQDLIYSVKYLRNRLNNASFSANAKGDLLYSMSLLLRSIHVRDKDLIKERGEWKKLVLEDQEMFNDVKMAYDGDV